MESEAEHWCCLWLRRLRSSENCIVGVSIRSGRINQLQCSIPGLSIGWFFRFCFRLRQPRQPSFHSIISDGVTNGIGRNCNVLILPTPIPSSLWLRLITTESGRSHIRFSPGHKLSYDSDSDSVASRRSCYGSLQAVCTGRWKDVLLSLPTGVLSIPLTAFFFIFPGAVFLPLNRLV